MKSVLISIRPHWALLIAEGKKTIEIRKTKPKLETPFKCYIYCTKDFTRGTLYQKPLDLENAEVLQGKVIGEFVCDRIYEIGYDYFYPCGYEVSMGEISRKELYEKSCLSFNQMDDYLNTELGYGWHISNLVIYDKPKELSEFRIKCKGGCDIPYLYSPPCENCRKDRLTRPPQSWCYVESEVDTE